MAGYSPRAGDARSSCGAAPRTCAASTSWPPRRTGGAGSCCSATTSTARCRRSGSCSTRPCSPSASSWPATSLDDDDRAFREMQLEILPPSPAKAVQELSDYDWRSQEAREDYEQIKDLLGREMLDQRFAGMKQALENATDEDRQRGQRDARRPQRAAGQAPSRRGHRSRTSTTSWPSTASSSRRTRRTSTSCSTRWPSGPPPRSGFRNSLSPEQRAELDALAQQAFGSPSLMNALNRLDAHLQAARPGRGLDRLAAILAATTRWAWARAPRRCADLAELEQLAEQLSQSYAGATMDDVDLDMLARQLGDEAAVDARTLAELERALGEPGLPRPRLRRAAAAVAQGDAPARPDGAARRGATAFGPPWRARHPPRRCGRRADRRDPAVGVRRHRAVERHPHDDQRGAAAGRHGGRRSRRFGSPSTTSRSPRPRPARRPRWRCWSTRRSRW